MPTPTPTTSGEITRSLITTAATSQTASRSRLEPGTSVSSRTAPYAASTTPLPIAATRATSITSILLIGRTSTRASHFVLRTPARFGAIRRSG